MREIKFRQPKWIGNKFAGWHYWGFTERGEFAGIIPPIEKAKQESQQYTGLKDKNGKEIYEGDVVDNIVIDGSVYTASEVFFDEGTFSLKIKNGLGGLDYAPCLYEIDLRRAEIVGNIYESLPHQSNEGKE